MMTWKCLPLLLLLSCSALFLQAQPLKDSAVENSIWDLQQCLDYALTNSLSIKQQMLNRQDAEIGLKQAKGSRLPSVTGGGRYGNAWGRSIDRTTNQFVPTQQRIQTNGLFFNASIPIYAGFQVNNSIKQARNNVEVADSELATAKNDVALMVAQLYMNVIFNKEVLRNSQDKVATTQTQVEQLEKQVKVGAIARTELLQMQSTLASNEAELIQQENNVRFALLQLQQAMQKPVETGFDIDIPELDANKYPWIKKTVEEVYGIALGTQPQISAAREREESAILGMKVAKGNMLPLLTLSGSSYTNYSDQNTELIEGSGEFSFKESEQYFIDASGLPDEVGLPSVIPIQEVSFERGEFRTINLGTQYRNNWSNEVLLNLSVPIFEGFKRSGDYQRAKIQKNIAALNVVEVETQLRQDIEQAYNEAYSAVKIYDAAQKSVMALEENLRVVETRFETGAANSVEFQIASNSLFTANTEMVRAKYDYIYKLKLLEFYLGQPIVL
ncbi:TolC family protein [Persicobacter diffluens]|uniref:Transporter n=1 Tax=Persicobacter diffluens TaxID=981 RepID=A0AAN5AJ04_9BACT|nr:transporter [Persicobacter diffluens]